MASPRGGPTILADPAPDFDRAFGRKWALGFWAGSPAGPSTQFSFSLFVSGLSNPLGNALHLQGGERAPHGKAGSRGSPRTAIVPGFLQQTGLPSPEPSPSQAPWTGETSRAVKLSGMCNGRARGPGCPGEGRRRGSAGSRRRPRDPAAWPPPPTVTLARGCPAWPHGWRPKETCGPRAQVSRASRGRAGIPSGHAGRPGVGAGSHLAFSHSPGTSGLMPASSRALGAVPGTRSEGAGRGARGCRAEAGVGGGRQLRDGPGFTDQPQGQTSDRDRGGR